MKTFSQFIVEAEQKLKMVRLKHGTSPDAGKKIKKSGFKGDEVHTSTNTDTARSFGRRYDENPSVITMLVPKKSIKNQTEKGAKAVKTQGQRGTDAMGRKHYSVVMDPEYASTKIVKQSGTVQKPKVPKRFRNIKDSVANEIRSPKDRNPQVSESKVRQDNESSRYEDDVYRSTQQKLADPRLKKLRRFFNRELGRYTT